MSAGIKANNDGSAAIQVGGTDRVTLSSAGVMEVPAGVLGVSKLSTASGDAPSYSARAWVNFDGTAQGTFAGGTSTVSRTAGSTTATVTTTNDHGLITGNSVVPLTGVAVDAYTVTVTGLKTFTITTVATTALTAASITFNLNPIRASGNVSSIADNGVGNYTVNFTTAMPDANYSVTGASGGGNATSAGAVYLADQVAARTPSLFRIYGLTTTGSLVDTPQMNISVFR